MLLLEDQDEPEEVTNAKRTCQDLPLPGLAGFDKVIGDTIGKIRDFGENVLGGMKATADKAEDIINKAFDGIKMGGKAAKAIRESIWGDYRPDRLLLEVVESLIPNPGGIFPILLEAGNSSTTYMHSGNFSDLSPEVAENLFRELTGQNFSDLPPEVAANLLIEIIDQHSLTTTNEAETEDEFERATHRKTQTSAGNAAKAKRAKAKRSPKRRQKQPMPPRQPSMYETQGGKITDPRRIGKLRPASGPAPKRRPGDKDPLFAYSQQLLDAKKARDAKIARDAAAAAADAQSHQNHHHNKSDDVELEAFIECDFKNIKYITLTIDFNSIIDFLEPCACEIMVMVLTLRGVGFAIPGYVT